MFRVKLVASNPSQSYRRDCNGLHVTSIAGGRLFAGSIEATSLTRNM